MTRPSRRSWTWHCLATGLLLVILLVLYAPVLAGLVRQWWSDPNYSHGFLIPLLSAFWVWQRRSRLAASRSTGGSWVGLPVLGAGIAMLTLGDIAAELFLTRTSLIVILAGLVLLLVGREIFRRVAFPLAYLLFMVPLPATIFYAVAFPLQRLAAENAAWTLDLIGVPALLDGNVIHLSEMSLGVTEACSGIRSLISLLALTVAWAYLTLSSRWAQVVLVVATVPVAVAANAARVVATGLIGQIFGIEYASGFFHGFSGWAIFLVAFAALLAVHGLLRAVGARGTTGPAETATPRRIYPESVRPGPVGGGWSARFVVAAGLLLATLGVLQLRSTGEAVPIARSLSTFPDSLGHWRGREVTPLETEVLSLLRVSDHLVRRYEDPVGRSIWLYIGYWNTQRKGAQPHSPRNCLPGSGWEPLEASRLWIPGGARPPLTVNRFVVQKDHAQQVVLYWYLAQGRPVSGEIKARVETVSNAILRNRTDGALVRVSTPVYGSLDETTAVLTEYVQHLYPLLTEYLPA
jgi:exosortase D (VPLPA-CTERM-specific)